LHYWYLSVSKIKSTTPMLFSIISHTYLILTVIPSGFKPLCSADYFHDHSFSIWLLAQPPGKYSYVYIHYQSVVQSLFDWFILCTKDCLFRNTLQISSIHIDSCMCFYCSLRTSDWYLFNKHYSFENIYKSADISFYCDWYYISYQCLLKRYIMDYDILNYTSSSAPNISAKMKYPDEKQYHNSIGWYPNLIAHNRAQELG